MRLGILSGTFDPVHRGHLAFAEQVLARYELDKIIFMPEHHPRYKTAVLPFKHRLAMLKLALSNMPQMEIYDTREDYFTLAGTIPRLEKKYPDAHFIIMLGSDAGRRLNTWEDINLLKSHITFIVALRGGDTEMSLRSGLSVPQIKPRVNYCHSPEPTVAASRIRQGLDSTEIALVDKYIAEHHLYD